MAVGMDLGWGRWSWVATSFVFDGQHETLALGNLEFPDTSTVSLAILSVGISWDEPSP